MTHPPTASDAMGGEQGNAGNSGEDVQKHSFTLLEFQLEQIPTMADRITRKHWTRAEREQYPFWTSILFIALFGIVGMVVRTTYAIGLPIAILMVLCLIPIVIYHLRSLAGRFTRQWKLFAGDGEMFRFLSDASLVLGHPVELGKPDEHFTTRLEIPFSEAVSATETYLKTTSLPDPLPSDAPPGFKLFDVSQSKPSNSESHHVFQVEYVGTISRSLSIRVNALDSGSDVTIGFTLRPSTSETRDKVNQGLAGRIQDRFIAAKLLADIREAAGVEAIGIPVMESEPPPLANHAPSSAV